jgi:CheY-like chemotaxis protein
MEQTMELKEKILVVDDELCLRKFLRTLLEADGYHVDTVSSGKEAIARINKGEHPDFIILNVFTADMSGFETIQELMRLDRSLNVIMTSCSNEPCTIAEALRLGARDYLAIPFEKAKLDEAMLRKQRKPRIFLTDIIDELIAMAEQIECEQSEKSRKWWDEHRQEMRHPELSMQCPHCRMLERLRQLRAEQGSAERA